MDADLASVALETTAMWLPLVLALRPCISALLDEPLFVLFGGVSSSPDWFLMDLALGIFIDFLKSAMGLGQVSALPLLGVVLGDTRPGRPGQHGKRVSSPVQLLWLLVLCTPAWPFPT